MRYALLLIFLLPSVDATLAAAESDPPPYEPTSNYAKQTIRGWTVYINRRLLNEDKQIGERAVELLDKQLYDVARALPPKALAVVRSIPIWVELQDRLHACACYHPNRKWLIANGYNPDKTGSVEIANAATFLKWSRGQPSMVLHELAHGYHDRMPGGFGNPTILAAYRRAKDSGNYESVLHVSGRRCPAYALNNQQEYFAELSEAWFGANDFYPFVRVEVKDSDPASAAVLREAWGEMSEKEKKQDEPVGESAGDGLAVGP